MPPKAKNIDSKDKKKKKQKKDPNAPKKGMTAFLHYVQDQRETCKIKFPELSHKEVISKLSELWRELNQDQKAPYEKKAQNDKEKFVKAKAEYEKNKASHPVETKTSKVEDIPAKKHKKSTEKAGEAK